MIKHSLIISFVLISMINVMAEGPSLWGFNQWSAVANADAGALVVSENKHPETLSNGKKGCPFKVSPNFADTEEEMWFEIVSAGTGFDSYLYYEDEFGNWDRLSDDDGESYNFKAVVNLKPGAPGVNVAYSYWSSTQTYPYWASVTPRSTDPNLKNVPYLVVDGSGARKIEFYY